MAMQKCTALFQLTTTSSESSYGSRLAGWSESFYSALTNPTQVRSDFQALCRARAALLPESGAIVGQRYNQVNPTGPSRSEAVICPGVKLSNCDVPQMAALCRAFARNTNNVRNLILRGVPDARVVDGEFQPSRNWLGAFTSFVQVMTDKQFAFRGRDLAQTLYPVQQISDAGVMQLEVAASYVVGDYVRVLRTVNESDRKVGGRFRISIVTDATHYVLQGWDKGNTVRGQVRKDAIIFPVIGDATLERIITRKVGRPFGQYVGRLARR